MNNIASYFLLQKDITFLNFGSFGACPKPVFEDYQRWQLELETEPVQFIAINGFGYLKKSRAALAAFINCDADDLVYVSNPTYAINIIAKSLKLDAGDEIGERVREQHDARRGDQQQHDTRRRHIAVEAASLMSEGEPDGEDDAAEADQCGHGFILYGAYCCVSGQKVQCHVAS